MPATVPELSHFAGFHGTAPSMLCIVSPSVAPPFLLFFFCVFQLRAVISIRVILPAKGKQKQPDGFSGFAGVHRIVETVLSSKPGYKVIAGILENFGEKVCTDLLKKIDLFSGHDNDKLTMLIKANKSKRLVDFDFSLLQFIPYFHVSNLLSKQEEQIIMNSAYELKEAPIRKILLLHLDELKDVLIKTNGAQPGDTQIISVIEEQIKELYHQISIFEL